MIDPMDFKNFTKIRDAGVFDSKNLSLYSYSFNNPVRYIDPLGLWGAEFGADVTIAGYNPSTTIIGWDSKQGTEVMKGNDSLAPSTLWGGGYDCTFRWGDKSSKEITVGAGVFGKYLSVSLIVTPDKGFTGITINIGAGEGIPFAGTAPIPGQKE
jgi:hypothetical protein